MHPFAQRFLEAQLAGDAGRALALLDDALASGTSRRTIRSDVIQAAQYEIGQLAAGGRITVDEEHAATEIVHLALARLSTTVAARPGLARAGGPPPVARAAGNRR